MKTDFSNKLNKAITELPEYQFDTAVWDKIEARLDFEDKLEAALTGLPRLEYDNNVWENIERGVEKDQQQFKRYKSKRIVRYAASIAASVLFFSTILYKYLKPETTVTVSEEIVELFEEPIKLDVADVDPMEYINESCQQRMEVCNNPDFLEQKQQLFELDTEIKRLQEVIESYGESPAIIKSMVKMENMRSEILKDLIKTLRS
ncbi:MAG: hypothetical protein JXB49_31220 [Bacteroidales bacterium]|nr:hypothetical protein [Bacteroidales bacterium]